MRVKLSDAKSKEFSPIAEYCFQRFKEGKGVSIETQFSQKIYLIPESLADDKGTALLIMFSKSAFTFKGEQELNEFVLAGAGFPLQLGREISIIVNALIEHFKWDSGNPETEAMPQKLLTKGELNG